METELVAGSPLFDPKGTKTDPRSIRERWINLITEALGSMSPNLRHVSNRDRAQIIVDYLKPRWSGLGNPREFRFSSFGPFALTEEELTYIQTSSQDGVVSADSFYDDEWEPTGRMRWVVTIEDLAHKEKRRVALGPGEFFLIPVWPCEARMSWSDTTGKGNISLQNIGGIPIEATLCVEEIAAT